MIKVGFSSTRDSIIDYLNCYFSGELSATKRVAVFQQGSGDCINCYYNSDLYKLTTPGNSLLTDDFKRKENFEGWDFENTWYIDENTGYPELKFK